MLLKSFPFPLMVLYEPVFYAIPAKYTMEQPEVLVDE